MDEKRKREQMNNMRDFDEKDEKDPIRMFSWFTSDKLDKKAYWIAILALLAYFLFTNLPSLFR